MISIKTILTAPFRVLAELYSIISGAARKMASWMLLSIRKTYESILKILNLAKNGLLFVHKWLSILYSSMFRLALLITLIFLPAIIYFDPLGWIAEALSLSSLYFDSNYLFYALMGVSVFITISILYVIWEMLFSESIPDSEEKHRIAEKFLDFPSQAAAFLTLVLAISYIVVFRIDFLVGATVGSETRSKMYDQIGYVYAKIDGTPEPVARQRVRTFFGDSSIHRSKATPLSSEQVRIDDFVSSWCIYEYKKGGDQWARSNESGKIRIEKTHMNGFKDRKKKEIFWPNVSLKLDGLQVQNRQHYITFQKVSGLLRARRLHAKSSWGIQYKLRECK